MKAKKTNAVRIIEAQGLNYRILTYSLEDGLTDAISVARKLEVEPEIVFKTLVTCGKTTGISVFVIPGNYELNLKKAAAAAGDKSIEMLKSKDLLFLTGYIHGGCSPIGMKKLYPTYLEEIASQYKTIIVSGGQIGLQILINPQDLLHITEGQYADLI